MNSLTRHLVLILALVCINQSVYAQVFYGEGFEPLEGVPSPDEFVPPIQYKRGNHSQPTNQVLKDTQDAYVRKDYATILRLLRPFAEQGDAPTQSNLGYMYANGQGVTKDDKEAARWYRLAAEQGDVGAQAYLKTNIAGSYSATDMPELAKKSGCTACHKIDTKLVGPAWMDVSKKYRGATEYSYSPRGSAAADAERMSLVDGLAMKVAKGGTGNWGRAAMIANSPKVSDPDIRTLVNFILGLSK